MRKNRKQGAGKAIISSVLICLVIGIAYCWSVFEKALVQSGGWSNTQASLPYSVFMLCYAISMLMGGCLQRRLGMRRTCISGGIVLAVGLCISALSSTVTGLIIGFGILVGTGQAMCYSCVISTPLRWVSQERRGLMTGITTGAVGFSSIYMTPLITSVIEKNNVQLGFLAMLAIVAPVVLIFSRWVELPQGEGTLSTMKLSGPALKEIVGSQAVYQVFFLSFSCSLYGQIIVGHIANIAYIQAAIENGAFYVVLLSVCNCLGRFLCGMLSDYISGPRLLQIIYAIGAVNILCFTYYRTVLLLAIGTMLIGFGYGASHSVVPTIISEYFGTENFSSYFGITSLAAGAAGVFGPLLAGAVMDSSGSYLYAYLASAGCLAAASCVSGKIKLSEKTGRV